MSLVGKTALTSVVKTVRRSATLKQFLSISGAAMSKGSAKQFGGLAQGAVGTKGVELLL